MNKTKIYRHELHKIPELCLKEYKTQEYIIEILKNNTCGIEKIAGTGILAYFDNKKESTLAFRADMDALYVNETTGLEYSSVHDGLMHACGHDAHMAILLSLGDWLNENISKLSCNVLLIFQPAEESISGARLIVNSLALKKYNIKEIYALHMWPGLTEGVIASKSGPLMAMSSEISIKIFGKASHAAKKSEGIDAALAMCKLVPKLYEMFETEIPKSAHALLHFGKLNSGVMTNIVSDISEISGTVRAFDYDTFNHIINRISQICKESDIFQLTKTEIEIFDGYPPVINNFELFERVNLLAKKNDFIFKKLEHSYMTAEDFSIYQAHYPGLMSFLGTGSTAPLHNGNFDFNEDIMENGLNYFIMIVENFQK